MTDHPSTGRRYGIAELATLGGVSRRTVRYYVQRGLISPPTGTGRGSHYTDTHLNELVRVRTWQEQGVSLAEIEGRLAGDEPRPDEPDISPARPQVWTRVVLADGVELCVRANSGVSPGKLQRVARAALRALSE